MKKTVLDYINLQIEFNKRMEETWTKLVPKLEGVSVEGVGVGIEEGGEERVRSTSELKGGGQGAGDGLVGV